MVDRHPARVRPTSCSDFVDWKTERGFHVDPGVTGTPEVGTTTDADPEPTSTVSTTTPRPSCRRPASSSSWATWPRCPTFSRAATPPTGPTAPWTATWCRHLLRPLLAPPTPTQLQAILDKTLMYDQFTMPDPELPGRGRDDRRHGLRLRRRPTATARSTTAPTTTSTPPTASTATPTSIPNSGSNAAQHRPERQRRRRLHQLHGPRQPDLAGPIPTFTQSQHQQPAELRRSTAWPSATAA